MYNLQAYYYYYLIASKPVLSRGRWRQAATEIRIRETVISEVIFIFNYPSLSIKVTVIGRSYPTVNMKIIQFAVPCHSCTVHACNSPDVYQLKPSTLHLYIRDGKQIHSIQRSASIILVIHAIGREVTCGSPVSGGIADVPHAGH